ncbi:ubpA [Symbiodinium sp. CCMP2592]|nr:ubpA [Symbiodinium sp. CCMP2592]
MIELDMERSQSKGALYLLQKFRRQEKDMPDTQQEPTKLAIGVEGGFLPDDKYETIKEYSLLVAAAGERTTLPYPSEDLPMIVSSVCEAIVAHQAELILTLVGYAVGVGNVWRFPYLTYTYGGGAFLIPYGLSLLLLGIPLFVLELGLGQLTRRGTLGMWTKLGLPRWQGVGLAAMMCTYLVGLYYIVILAWTIFYLGRTLAALPSGHLPWSDVAPGVTCPTKDLYLHKTVADSDNLVDSITGLLNPTFVASTWCPAKSTDQPPADYVLRTLQPTRCPARMAKIFWEEQALNQSSGLDELGGLNPGLVVSLTIAWFLIWLIVFKGVKSSGKAVYVTATLPYVCLGIFLVRALTLPNAFVGLKFLFEADFSHLANPQVWIHGAVQIFFSLGVGYGSIVAFGSYGSKSGNFVRDATSVAIANCGTSILAGCVVFPVLGFLAQELHETDPCISADSLDNLKSIGLSGTGLAFVAFPIAVSQMPGSFFFAILFFFMMLLLGIDSQFAYIETLATVLADAGWGERLPRPALTGLICFVSYLIGLVFVSRAGIYFLDLFDNYVSIYVMFAVGCLECVGLIWTRQGQTWERFKSLCVDHTGRHLGRLYEVVWGWICPGLCLLLVIVSITPPFGKLDVMDAVSSKPFPEGTGFFPSWTIPLGWTIASLPIAAMAVTCPVQFLGCEKSGDTQNLWLNLSDGFIGGGRKFWDGSGGSNGALDHFTEENAKGNFYPLVVKLGTITPAGADVYSYAPDEDKMVKDPLLAKHLEHWGIDVMKMEKTDKTLAEMQVDLNLNYDWSKICESGDKPLVRLRGPGLVGLKNLGQSCYMNSSVQLLLALPEVKQRYLDADLKIRRSAAPEVQNDLLSQVAKLVSGLNGPRYAPPLKDGDDEEDPRFSIQPQMFRSLIGRGHAEFSTARQQDAAEFVQYFLEQIARLERSALGTRLAGDSSTTSLFEFAVEERLQESSGQKRVKYSKVQQNMLGLPVKLDDAENLQEVTAFRAAKDKDEQEAKKPKTEGEPEEPKPVIPLSSCLARFGASEDGVQFRGVSASKTSRLASMPRYLLVQLQRYYVDEKWPETLNLEHLRGRGLQPGEEPMPEEADAPQPEALDDMIVACFSAKSLPLRSQHRILTKATLVSMDIVVILTLSGQAKRASLAVGNSSAEAAIAWCYSPTRTTWKELSPPWVASPPVVQASPKDYDDGVGEYTLVGFVSHIGKHTSHGHYVCHMRRGKGDSWVIFDDSKVAQSEAPPLDLGYIYLYRRKDAPASRGVLALVQSR